MRLVQSIFAIMTFYPSLVPALLASQPPAVHQESVIAMSELSGYLNLTRRAMRLFWCLGSFQASWAGFSRPNKDLEAWFGVLSGTFFGMFGLIESVTLLDLVHVKHVSLLGFDEAVRIDAQSQGFWLLALLCASLSSALAIVKGFAHRAVPDELEMPEDDDKKKMTEAETEALAEKRKLQREVAAEQHAARSARLSRKFLADVLDMVIPAWSMGILQIDLGRVSLAMLGSTILTAYAVWERCAEALDGQAV